MKRYVYLRLLALVAMLFFATSLVYAHDFYSDGIFFNYNEDGISVSVTFKGENYNSYREYFGSIVIPSIVSYNGKTYSVTNIAANAFSGCSNLTSIDIPNTISTIGVYAFYYCI